MDQVHNCERQKTYATADTRILDATKPQVSRWDFEAATARTLLTLITLMSLGGVNPPINMRNLFLRKELRLA